ncbi:MAG: hypothetical protein FWG43_06260 [Clostridiales bacterium]|nr:hypothetical protein [Clostridiales bacterium]
MPARISNTDIELSNPPTGEDITASFTDRGFLAAVREIINKPTGPILDTDVALIEMLYVDAWETFYTIKSLSGIEHFLSLKFLSCSYQEL